MPMRISHHWLLPAAVVVASAAPIVAPLLANDATAACDRSAVQADAPACALARHLRDRVARSVTRA